MAGLYLASQSPRRTELLTQLVSIILLYQAPMKRLIRVILLKW